MNYFFFNAQNRNKRSFRNLGTAHRHGERRQRYSSQSHDTPSPSAAATAQTDFRLKSDAHADPALPVNAARRTRQALENGESKTCPEVEEDTAERGEVAHQSEKEDTSARTWAGYSPRWLVHFAQHTQTYICCNYKLCVVIIYYGSGLLFFTRGPEKWTTIQTLYFLTVTLTTVGYGDVTPRGKLSQLVAIIFIFSGIAIIFPILAAVAERFQKCVDNLIKDVFAVQTTTTWTKMSLACAYILLSVSVGCLYFGFQEAHNDHWSAVDPLWWTICTVTTVGYGDLDFNHSTEARVFLIFFIPFSVVLVGSAISSLSNAYADIRREKKEHELLARFDMDLIRSLDTNGDGVDRNEYILGMLKAMNLVDPEKIRIYTHQFNEYDVDGSGVLNAEDLDIIEANMKENLTHSPG